MHNSVTSSCKLLNTAWPLLLSIGTLLIYYNHFLPCLLVHHHHMYTFNNLPLPIVPLVRLEYSLDFGYTWQLVRALCVPGNSSCAYVADASVFYAPLAWSRHVYPLNHIGPSKWVWRNVCRGTGMWVYEFMIYRGTWVWRARWGLRWCSVEGQLGRTKVERKMWEEVVIEKGGGVGELCKAEYSVVMQTKDR